jgi:hypothetical protein
MEMDELLRPPDFALFEYIIKEVDQNGNLDFCSRICSTEVDVGVPRSLMTAVPK